MSKKEFTLNNLLSCLSHYDFKVVDTGTDIDLWLEKLRANPPENCPTLPPPRFFAIVESEGNILEVFEVLTFHIWNHFERGLMEFDAFLHEGKTRISIRQALKKVEPYAQVTVEMKKA